MIADDLDTLDAQELREKLRASRAEVAFKQAVIDKITHENAVLKRLKFAAKSEAYTAEQKSLLDETLDADLAAVAVEIERMGLTPAAAGDKRIPKRERLPANLPRLEIRHDPASTTCGCGEAMQRVGEDVAEKLHYQPGVFTVERHVRGKWACRCCEKIVQAPVAPTSSTRVCHIAGAQQPLLAGQIEHALAVGVGGHGRRLFHLFSQCSNREKIGNTKIRHPAQS